MIGVLLIGFWKLQVIDSDKFLQWAERNRVRSIPVIAPRGRMLDRDGPRPDRQLSILQRSSASRRSRASGKRAFRPSPRDWTFRSVI